MPIYEYRCEDCGAQFEEFTASPRDADRQRCRFCRSERVTRLLSAFAVHSARPAPEPGPCETCGAGERGLCGLRGSEI